MDNYIEAWENEGHFWAQNVHPGATIAQIRQADELYPQVVARLQELGELEDNFPQRVWDYCVGKFGKNPVSEIIDELV